MIAAKFGIFAKMGARKADFAHLNTKAWITRSVGVRLCVTLRDK